MRLAVRVRRPPNRDVRIGFRRRFNTERRSMAEQLPQPRQRYMTVIAQDPSVRAGDRIVMAKVAVPAEDLIPGPMGYRVQVVDYDSTHRRFQGAHELPASYDDEPAHWRK